MYLIPTMNNTKNTLLMVVITSLLIMGINIIMMQSYAGFDNHENKKFDANNSKTNTSSQTDKKGSSQHMGQDNLCYMGNETCIQANKGQEMIGKDSDEVGFNGQSTTIQQSFVPTSTRPPTLGQTPTTLNICTEVINTGTIFIFEPSDFTIAFNTPASPVLFQGANEGCTAVTIAPGTYEFSERRPIFAENNSVGVIGDCTIRGSDANTVSIGGTIAGGETQTCTITNTIK